MADTLLRLDHLEVSNYRCFERLALDLHPALTVIVARNGCGKTAILDAIAVALGPYVGAFDEGKAVHFAPSDARLSRRRGGALAELESQYPVTVRAVAQVDHRSEEWDRVLRGARAHTTFADARPLSDFGAIQQHLVRAAVDGRDDSPVLPLVAYYGTGRLWGEMRLTAGRKAVVQTSRTAGYADCLSSASRYKAFADWFERLCRAEYEERHDSIRLAVIQGQLSAIRTAVDTVLQPCGWHSIAYHSAERGIIAHHERYGMLAVDQLSDGVRAMVGLTADIAHRAARLNSHLGSAAVVATPGIVLIDEVDMHLHPEWQQVVVDALRAAFPSLQLVVTTHSPQVLSTVARESICLLRESPDGWVAESPALQTRGVESAEVLSRLMRVDPVPRVAEARWLADYQALIDLDQADSPTGRALRQQLEAHFGAQHPVILDCDRLLRYRRFQQRRDAPGGRAVPSAPA
ncbi:MAG: AAA family ATPase [Fimbriimonadaceae bacterium]|nr:AAA family ATPase [Fimbriimonadaceae bacterium]